MTTAAADPWAEPEDAEDFWADDLGSIDDDASWDLDSSTAGDSSEPAVPLPLSVVRSNEGLTLQAPANTAPNHVSGAFPESIRDAELSTAPELSNEHTIDPKTEKLENTMGARSTTGPGDAGGLKGSQEPESVEETMSIGEAANEESETEALEGVKELELLVPEAAELEEEKPEAAAPERAQPDTGELDATESEEAELSAKEPEAAELEPAQPETQIQKSGSPEIEAPETEASQTKASETGESGIAQPSQQSSHVTVTSLGNQGEYLLEKETSEAEHKDPNNGDDIESNTNGVVYTSEHPGGMHAVDGVSGGSQATKSPEQFLASNVGSSSSGASSVAVEHADSRTSLSLSNTKAPNGTVIPLQPQEAESCGQGSSPGVAEEISILPNEPAGLGASSAVANAEPLIPEAEQAKTLADQEINLRPAEGIESEVLTDEPSTGPLKQDSHGEPESRINLASESQLGPKPPQIAGFQESGPEAKLMDSNQPHGRSDQEFTMLGSNDQSRGENPEHSALHHEAPDSKNQESANVPNTSSTSSGGSSEVEILKSQIQQLKAELQARSDPGEVDADSKSLEARLAEVEKERDDAKRQLEGFLSKISSMKTVVRNYKLAQEELEETQQEVAQLKQKTHALEQEKAASEEENLQLLVQKEKLENKVAVLESESEKLADTIQVLKTRTGDLNSECERLSQQLSSLRREYSSKSDTLQDEKYALENEVSKLCKKVSDIRAMYSELELAEQDLRMENKNLQIMINELKGLLETKEKEEERYTGLVESNKQTFDREKEALQSRLQELEGEAQSTQNRLAKLQEENSHLVEELRQGEEKRAELREENQKITQLEEEIHSKQMIIGKLRHEAVILNEHLTKSLSMLKQNLGDPNSTVDKELVSNLIVKFVQIPRGDTKKFETLSLIAGLLNWDEKRKMEAGLVNSGAKNGEDGKPLPRLSFISLWTDFLDKESKNKS